MKIELLSMSIENFKGIKKFDFAPDGKDVVIRGVNGSGKTSVYDAFLWLLFGKNSEGKSEFGIRPVDSENEMVKGLVLKVDVDLGIDDEEVSLRKIHRERVVKEEVRGFETKCWIDSVPKKVSEFDDYIASIIGENSFKLLADLSHFNKKLHWKDRREILMNLVDVGQVEGFDEVVEKLGKKSVEDYCKVLRDRKKGLVDERSGINPRIDEIRRNLENKSGEKSGDRDDLKSRRAKLKKEEIRLGNEKKELLGEEEKRRKDVDKLTELKRYQIKREKALANEGDGKEGLRKEKGEVKELIRKRKVELGALGELIKKGKAKIEAEKEELRGLSGKLDDVRKRYREATEGEGDEIVCFACKQSLPEDKLGEVFEAIKKKGTELKGKVQKKKKVVQELEDGIEKEVEDLKKKEKEFDKKDKEAEDRIEEIKKMLDSEDKVVDVESDNEWCGYRDRIEELEKSLADSKDKEIDKVEMLASGVRDDIAELNDRLANFDRYEKDNKRVKELEELEKKLSQDISEVDREIADVKDYEKKQSELIESEVNKEFKFVRFKLFEFLLNGSVNPTCKAMYEGVEFDDLSFGQQIKVGVDIVNRLSDNYKLSVPMFIDHSESLTYDMRSGSQVLRLVADVNESELKIELKGKEDGKK